MLEDILRGILIYWNNRIMEEYNAKMYENGRNRFVKKLMEENRYDDLEEKEVDGFKKSWWLS